MSVQLIRNFELKESCNKLIDQAVLIIGCTLVFRSISIDTILTSDINFWAKTQQLDFRKKLICRETGAPRSTWDLLIRAFGEARPTVRGYPTVRGPQLVWSFVYFSKITRRIIIIGLVSTHQWIRLDESFSYMVSDLSWPSRSRGKLFFVCPFLMANPAVGTNVQ